MITMNVSGNITDDAIITYVNGVPVVRFTIASNHRYTSHDGELKQEVTYIACQIWEKKEVESFFYKGRAVTVTGTPRIRKYVTRDFEEKMSLSLRVSFFQLFGKNKVNQVAEKRTQPQQQTEPVQTVINETQPVDMVEDLPF